MTTQHLSGGPLLKEAKDHLETSFSSKEKSQKEKIIQQALEFLVKQDSGTLWESWFDVDFSSQYPHLFKEFVLTRPLALAKKISLSQMLRHYSWQEDLDILKLIIKKSSRSSLLSTLQADLSHYLLFHDGDFELFELMIRRGGREFLFDTVKTAHLADFLPDSFAVKVLTFILRKGGMAFLFEMEATLPQSSQNSQDEFRPLLKYVAEHIDLYPTLKNDPQFYEMWMKNADNLLLESIIEKIADYPIFKDHPRLLQNLVDRGYLNKLEETVARNPSFWENAPELTKILKRASDQWDEENLLLCKKILGK